MTTLNGKALTRETAALVRAGGKLRPLIVESFAGYLALRPKGMRQRYAVDWASIWSLGAKKAAEEARLLRLARRKGRK